MTRLSRYRMRDGLTNKIVKCLKFRILAFLASYHFLKLRYHKKQHQFACVTVGEGSYECDPPYTSNFILPTLHCTRISFHYIVAYETNEF